MTDNELSTYKICKLNEVAWFQEGPGVRKNQFRTSGVKLLNVGNICDRELILDKTNIYISEEEAYGRYKHFLVDEGDLLIASSGIKVDYFDKKITFAKKEHLPLCMNTSTIRFKVLDKNVLDINYLRHFLASKYFTKQVQFHITGSAQLNFGPSHLNKMTIILPPIDKQKEIAQILDKADEIRTKKKLANDKLDEFLKSTFINMFGDPVKASKYSKQNLDEYLLYVQNGISRRRKTPQNIGELVYRIKEIRENYIDYSDVNRIPLNDKEKDKYRVNKGELLFIRVNGNKDYVGRNVVFKGYIEDTYFNDHIMRVQIKEDKLNPIYLSRFLNLSFGKEEIKKYIKTSAGQFTINQQGLGSVCLPIPPIAEQNKFAEIVEKVEAQKQKNEQVIEQMNNLFNSLSQKAFKGEL